ncbi:hypothetical protein PPYR_01713 [Photinus pyralis]|uniref:3'-5' exonuclease domain-containing protein n=1 Tax=Photinus pyralis TaxID=7054 RepID=A0A1Y1N0U3_PHOPY|nr:uncharacterized protein LOC116181688 [Photinus pyralis]XP_031357964.1 uncharacterized protein LOC116181688 [Photinus pyralis]KAB0804743.1 hypothetical protein PPYR_01713 [Photinus pyralis]
MKLVYKRGQRLLLELADTNVFEGVYDGGNINRMELINILDHYTQSAIGGRLSFYINEIQSVKELNEDGEEVKEEKEDKLPSTEVERLQLMARTYIYINKIEEACDVVDVLANCECIGIVGIGAEFSTTKPVELLVMSSWSQVYIVNLSLCTHSGFPSGLAKILESNYIQKVGHNLVPLSQSLWHCYKVTINNTFDTQIADEKIEVDRGHLYKAPNLADSLKKHLHLPCLLEDTPSTTSEMWSERPLPDFRKIQAAQLVTYLITLRNIQKRLLLKDYYDPIEEYIEKIHKSDCYRPHVDFKSDTIPFRLKEILDSF